MMTNLQMEMVSLNNQRRNNQLSNHGEQNNCQQQIVTKRATDMSVLESEDEDGFPIDASPKSKDVQEPQVGLDVQKDKRAKETKKKARDVNDVSTGKKRKVKGTKQDEQPIRGLDTDADGVPGENNPEKKKRKRKNKKKNQDSGGDVSKNQTTAAVGNEATLESMDKQSLAMSSQVRTFSNGFVIEELAMGRPDGKRASRGCQVSVHYIGKLMENAKYLMLRSDGHLSKFHLGVGRVIKGLDVGVEGMRIGDKRRLTIPPSMGYGDKGAGKAVPPNAWLVFIPSNSWLVFDIELVNVGW